MTPGAVGARREQAGGEERREALLQRARIVPVFGLGAGDQLHRIGRRKRVGQGAEHEMHPPEQLLARQMRQRARERSLEALHGRGVELADQCADRLGRFGVGTAQQAHEGAAARARVADHLQAGADEGADDRLGCKRLAVRVCFEPVELGEALGIHRIEPPAEHCFDQRVLRAEVVIDRGEIDARRGGEHAHRGCFETMVHEQLFGNVEDAGTGLVRRFDCSEGHRGTCSNVARVIQTNV